MGKQKRNYNMARIRPTSYSHVYTYEQFEKIDVKTQKVFSNLLHNYEKMSKGQQQKSKLTFVQLRNGDSSKMKAIDVRLKQLQRKLPFQSHFLTQKSSCLSQRKKNSNYSLYLQRSLSRQSRQSSHKLVLFNRTPIETSRIELIQPCKITPMKIATRRVDSEIIKDQRDSADLIRRRNKSGKVKMRSQINISRQLGEELIEPWKMKNYQSILL